MDLFPFGRVVFCVLFPSYFTNVVHCVLNWPGWSKVLEELLLPHLQVVDVLLGYVTAPWNLLAIWLGHGHVQVVLPFLLYDVLLWVDRVYDLLVHLELVCFLDVPDGAVSIFKFSFTWVSIFRELQRRWTRDLLSGAISSQQRSSYIIESLEEHLNTWIHYFLGLSPKKVNLEVRRARVESKCNNRRAGSSNKSELASLVLMVRLEP